MGTRAMTADRAMGAAKISTTNVVVVTTDDPRFALTEFVNGYHTRFPIEPSPIPEGADNAQTIEISVNYT